MTWGLAAVAAAVAAAAVWSTAHTPPARTLWAVAAVAGGGAAALVATASPVPVAAGLAAGGLAAAALVDAAEGRIPTPVAHGTTAVSLAALAAYGWARDEWPTLVVGPVLLAAALVAGCTVLWLAGGMGFGDVRLAAATVTAMVSGAEAALLVAWCGFAVSGLAVAVLRLAGRRPQRLPFGPGLVVGWLVAILVT